MISKELVAASTIPIVLSLLKEKDNYGYQLIKDVQRISGGSLQWKEGSLYPVLLKLEKKGLISSYIKQEDGRNRKYYSLNKSGKTALSELKNEWTNINQIMVTLWNPQTRLT
ncbi:MAG: PadR family transcriptional regulator [Bacteroidota bacterium]